MDAVAQPRTGLLRALPVGGRLPAEAWNRRHTGILVLLWLHALAIPFYGMARGIRPWHAFLEGSVVTASALFASPPGLTRRVRTLASSLGLLASSAILVHLSGGVIEMHFHFFVMVAVVALYQDWLPFLAAIAFVLVHHGMIGVIDPDSVYNHYAARNNPWMWAAIHALFISGTSAACLVSWGLNERILAERRRAEERLVTESRIVETLYSIGQTLAADLDTQHVVQTVTDAATRLSGAAFGAFFYNVVDDTGGKYLLYSLSGAPVEAFADFGLPRATQIFAPTFAGEGVVRLDDVAADPRFGQNPPHNGMPRGHLPVASYLAVPVKSREGEVLGGLFFGHPERARFTEVEERIVVGIAAQAAISLDNSRLYARQRSVAETLQRSLLPEHLPVIPGLDAAARYTAGGPGVEVGGDWYDVISLPGGRVAVAMGDVVGRGEKAAALMGQLKAAVRIYSFESRAPAAVLAGLNNLLINSGPEQMATLLYAVIDSETATLTVANAGHPPPLVREPDGTVRPVESEGGVPLGALAGARFTEVSAPLRPGSTLLLYTDGLVEVRGEALDLGLATLAEAVRGSDASTAAAMCEAVSAAMASEDKQDDTALLVLRVVPLGDRISLHLPAEPASLAVVRATIRRWMAEIGAGEAESYELLVVTGELSTNAIRHAGATSREFTLDATVEDGILTLSVSDSGTWRPPRNDIGGRGLGIVEAFVQDLRIDRTDQGTTVTIVRPLGADVPRALA